MPQILKPELRHRIELASFKLFSQKGFHQCTMTEIATEAGMSVGNLYRYFPSKDELLGGIISATRVEDLLNLMTARMRSYPATLEISALLDTLMEHRILLCFLVFGASGTPYEHFVPQLTNNLSIAFMEYATRFHPQNELDRIPQVTTLIHLLYANLIQLFTALIRSELPETEIKNLLNLGLTAHISGMHTLLTPSDNKEKK